MTERSDSEVNNVGAALLAITCIAIVGLLAARISTVSSVNTTGSMKQATVVASPAPTVAVLVATTSPATTTTTTTIPPPTPAPTTTAPITEAPTPAPTTEAPTIAPTLPPTVAETAPPPPTDPPATDPPVTAALDPVEALAQEIVASQKVCPTLPPTPAIEKIAGGTFGKESDLTDADTNNVPECDFLQRKSATALPRGYFWFDQGSTIADVKSDGYRYKGASVNPAIVIETKGSEKTSTYSVSALYETSSGVFVVVIYGPGNLQNNTARAIKGMQAWLHI